MYPDGSAPLPYVLLSEKEVAALLGVSVRTVQGWRAASRSASGPKHVKIGGKVRYRSTAIDEWIRENETN